MRTLRLWGGPLVMMALAALCALASFRLGQAPVNGAPAPSANVVAATANLQTRLAEHQSQLYQAVVAPQPAQRAFLERTEVTLSDGASWLESMGEGAGATALRDYLRTASAVKTTPREEQGAALAGAVHKAAGEAMQALFQVVQRHQAMPVVTPQRSLNAVPWSRIFLVISLILCVVALLVAVGVRTLITQAYPADLPPSASSAATVRDVGVLQNAGDQLQGSADQAGRAAAALQETIRQIAQFSQSQAGTLHQVATVAIGLRQSVVQAAATRSRGQINSPTPRAMPDVTACAAEVQARSAKATEGAREVAQVIEGLTAALNETLNLLATLGADAERSTAALTDLTERTVHIDQTVAAMKSIATQTNMLALNAAIEAARAGERGRGFAVVADSVRNLAGKAQVHAKEIEARMAGIAQVASTGIEAAERQRGFSHTVTQGLTQVRVHLEELVSRVAGSVTEGQLLQAESERLTQAVRAAAQATYEHAVAPEPSVGAETVEGVARIGDELRFLALGASETAIALDEARRLAHDLQGEVRAVAQGVQSVRAGAERLTLNLRNESSSDPS